MGKAQTKAAKLRKKRGRPLLPPTDRQPNGQKSRRLASVRTSREQSEAATVSVAREARTRVYGLPIGQCAKEEAGYELGRLYLRNIITKNQLSAGNRMAATFARYYSLMGYAGLNSRAQDLFRVKGEPVDSDPDAARKAANAVMALEQCLGAFTVDGQSVMSVMKRVCVQDEAVPANIEHYLKYGLDALVEFYSGQLPGRKPAR